MAVHEPEYTVEGAAVEQTTWPAIRTSAPLPGLIAPEYAHPRPSVNEMSAPLWRPSLMVTVVHTMVVSPGETQRRENECEDPMNPVSPASRTSCPPPTHVDPSSALASE
jgi:hypothetical protein